MICVKLSRRFDIIFIYFLEFEQQRNYSSEQDILYKEPKSIEVRMGDNFFYRSSLIIYYEEFKHG